jgi:hypothetical protein
LNIPLKLAKGDSYTWKDSQATDNLGNSIDSSLWTLKYAIRGSSALDLTASADGSGWQTSITAAQSGALTPGKFYWQSYAVDIATGAKRVTLSSGDIEITKDLVSAGGQFDGRSQSQIDLDAVQAAMRAMISGGAVQGYTIGGRQIQKMQMSDLIVLESKLKAQVAREKKADSIKNGLGNPHNLFVRFK